MITLYLDMDGVLADFHKAYRVYDPEFDRKKFRQAVMQYKIFEDLEFMPNTQKLLNHVCRLPVRIEILTSKGTFDPFQGNEAARQKQVWLNKHNLPWKANFVRTKSEKAQYATPYSILVDDSVGCVDPFTAKGGHGILHIDSKFQETIDTIDRLLLQIPAMDALNGK